MDTKNNRTSILLGLVLLSAYVGLVLLYHIPRLSVITPDAVAYARMARRFVSGDFMGAVTGHWSPFLSFCLAPLLFLVDDDLVAIRIIIIFWGGLFVFSFGLLVKRFVQGQRLQLIAMACVVVLAAEWSHSQTPDLILCAWLSLYFYLVTEASLWRSKWKAFGVGIVGGVAYLTKHYALPFFLLSFPLLLFLSWRRERDSWPRPLAHYIKFLCVGFFGFFLIAGIWFGPLSLKYGRLLFETSGRFAYQYSVCKYNKIPFPGSMQNRLQKPQEGDISVWERGLGNDFLNSGGESGLPKFCNAKTQALVLLDNFMKLISYLYKFGCAPGVIVFPLLAGILFIRRAERRFFAFWVLIGAVTYSAGYLLVYFGAFRYSWPIMMLNFLGAFYLLGEALPFFERRHVRASVKRFFLFSVLASFLFSPLWFLLKPFFYYLPSKHAVDFFKENNSGRVVTDVSELRCPLNVNLWKEAASSLAPFVTGPFASDGLFFGYAIVIAHYLGQPYLGAPCSAELDRKIDEMRKETVKFYIVFNDFRGTARKLKNDKKLPLIYSCDAFLNSRLSFDVFKVEPSS